MGTVSPEVIEPIFTREKIIKTAMAIYPSVKLGGSATIAAVRNGYWVGLSLYVSKEDVTNFNQPIQG